MKQEHDYAAEYARRLMAVQPCVRAYVRSLVYADSDVEDVIQDIATAGWKSFPSYDTARSFDAWIMGIARNSVYLYLRNRKKKAVYLSDQVMEQIEATRILLEHAADPTVTDDFGETPASTAVIMKNPHIEALLPKNSGEHLLSPDRQETK
jgi:RNA polymerase sigma factor (sigma-70 family)